MAATLLFWYVAPVTPTIKLPPPLREIQARLPASIDSLQKQNRYFILRNGNAAYSINNPTLSGDKKFLQCQLDMIPPSHHLHLINGYQRENAI